MNFKTYKLIFPALMLIGTFLYSCSGETATENNETAAAEETVALELTPEQMASVDITVGPIAQKNLSAVVKANGQLAVPPQNKADVSVLSAGLIRKIHVLEGEQVQKGEVLVTLENQELIRIQQDYLSAKSNLAYLRAEYDRQTQLRDAGAGTGKSYQSSQAAFNAELARIQAYESQLRQLGIAPEKIAAGKIVSQFPLRAPISGTVGQISANTGTFVQPGISIMEVVDNSKIHCDLIVFEKDLMKVKVGQKVDFQLTNQGGQGISGTINGINKSFENESKGVIVHAVIDNKTHMNLIPGMYVTALIDIDGALTSAVPLEAVIRSEGRQFIFIVDEKASADKKGTLVFKKAGIRTGLSELGYVQIIPLKDLPPNTRIVTKGAFYLQSKLAGGGEE